jgi:hypothetical protein
VIPTTVLVPITLGDLPVYFVPRRRDTVVSDAQTFCQSNQIGAAHCVSALVERARVAYDARESFLTEESKAVLCPRGDVRACPGKGCPMLVRKG